MKLFAELSCVTDIIIYSEEGEGKYVKNWPEIFKEASEVILDIDDESIEKLLSNHDDEFAMFFRSSANVEYPVGDAKYFDSLKNDMNKELKKGHAIYLLDMDRSKAESIRNDTGVAVISIKELEDDNYFEGFGQKTIEKNRVYENSWDDFPSAGNCYASNALVINDRHFFDNATKDNRSNQGLDNIPGLVDRLLPTHFGGKYWVTIIGSSEHPKSESWWQKRYGRLQTTVNGLREYEIRLELVIAPFRTLDHMRCFMSNYFFGFVTHTLALLDSEKDLKVGRTNDLFKWEGVFKGIGSADRQSNSDTIWNTAMEKLKKAKDTCDNLAELHRKNAVGSDNTRQLHGILKKNNYSSQNPLLQDA